MLIAATAAAKKSILPQAEELADLALRLGLTLAVAFALQWLLFLAVGRLEKFLIRVGSGQSPQRARTLGGILRRLVTFLVFGGALIHGLDVLGWDVKPLLAGAGVLGLAIGFGAQALVRDTIAGAFILAEDQFAVGDLIEVNGKPATVEELNLRFTRLRDFNGYVHFVPNGELKIVTNRSRGWQRLAVDVPVAGNEDLDRVIAVCRRVAAAMNAEPEWKNRLLDPVELWGIEGLTSAEANLRFVVRSEPGPNAPEAARELRRRAHAALLEAGLRPGASREIAFAATAPPSDAAGGSP